MKKFFLNTCLFFYFLFQFSNAKAQNPVIDSIIADISIDTLLYRVEEISGARGVFVNGVTDTIKSRHKLKPGNELCYDYLIDKFASYGLTTDSLLFGTVGKNALAIQTGLVYPNQYYIICAHYDDMPNATIAPAADDDGSGVGAVLEAARVLSQYQFEYTIIYAVWDEEELGLAGSAAYASLANTNNDSLMGVINMDAIAWDSDNDSVARVHVRPIANSQSMGLTISNVNTTYNIGIDLQINNPGATYSDHASFWSNSFSAVLLIEDWDNDANTHYHTSTDLIQYFNIPYYEKMAKLGIASVATFAVPVGFVSVNSLEKEIPMQLFPNPTPDNFIIDLKKRFNSISVRVFDVQGTCHKTIRFSEQKLIQMDVAELSEGIYFVEVIADGEKKTLRLIKSR